MDADRPDVPVAAAYGPGTPNYQVMTPSDLDVELPLERADFFLPYPPEREHNDRTTFKQFGPTGSMYHLRKHLERERGCDPETLVVSCEQYILGAGQRTLRGSHYPDMIVAFDVDAELYKKQNGYLIARQGKPPDLVLEIGSEASGALDVGEKRAAYEALGIPEYWRFDETPDGSYHGDRLAGDRLEGGRYVPLDIRTRSDGSLAGYSAKLNVHFQWEAGMLVFRDPATGKPILTYDDVKALADEAKERRVAAERRLDYAIQRRVAAERSANHARRLREAAEWRANYARRKSAEAEIRRLRKQLRSRDAGS